MDIYTIYKATNIITGKSYIGYSSNWLSRKRQHKHIANTNKKNYLFYNSLNKHGFESFVWDILYQSKDKEHTLFVMEDLFIKEYNTLSPNGYNSKNGGGGGNLSEESREKISNSRIGIKFSEEHRKNLSTSHVGISLGEEHKKNISKSLIGKNKGKINGPLSQEHKLKLSASLSGRKYKFTKKLRCSCVICHQEISNNHIGIHYKKHT